MSVLKLALVGDIALNGDYINYYKQGINPFINLIPHLAEHDLVIGNLECMATGDQGENIYKKPRLSTTIDTLNYLVCLKVNIVTLAHNHIYDHLEDGFLKTLHFLDEHSIKYLGAGHTQEQAERPLIILKNGITIGLLNYITDDTNPNLPENAAICLNHFDFEKAEKDIAKLAEKVNYTIIIMHWGGRVEGGLYPDWHQPDAAKKLIDFGADAIIGHHSHTFQPFISYKNRYVFFSLGNFCFSDFTFEQKMHILPLCQRITSVISCNFTKDSIRASTEFYLNKGSYFNPFQYYNSIVKIQNFFYFFLFRHKSIWEIYFFHTRYIRPFLFFITRRDIGFIEKKRRIFNSLYRRLSPRFLHRKS